MEIDQTKKMEWISPDDELLPILKCVCGETFSPWMFTISIYSDTPKSCENCKRKFYFKNSIKIIGVIE